MSTTFQQKVYSLLLEIPQGRVTTYAILAQKLNLKAYQAIGRALRANLEPETYPCYKVVKTNGEVGGYLGLEADNIAKKVQKLEEEGIAIEHEKDIRFSRIVNLNNYLYHF
ncbi:MGMT family protein [Candidatus Woesearchaeota archaeon]|nr:MGMT family protein [Candidatus Woesearchaeota archaeon]